MDPNERAYLNYLTRLVRNEETKDYILLLERLWHKEFYGIIPNDQNREKDGLFLRDTMGEDIDHAIFGPCRVLEMLIALSKRMAYEISGSELETSFVNLFWELIDNLGLMKFDNLAVMQDAAHLEFDYILMHWLDRNYLQDGRGGIFPIKNWKKGLDKPQYKVEIWYQMMLYLSKNYEI